MVFADWKALFFVTLKTPKEAARHLLALDLPAQALWMALTLVSVVTSMVFAGLLQMAPMPAADMGELIRGTPAYDAPLIFALLQWARAVVSVFVLYWVGTVFGGQGRLSDVLAVMAWLQAVTFALMLGIAVLGVLMPFVSSLLILAMAVWWVWAVISALDVAHEFDSMVKSAAVLIVSIVGATVGLSIFLGVVASVFVGTT
ncbi:Yip1 family protein [Roseovarius sp. MMSF_3281]|uniref:Yip1 family protein n=1 Tax=Roseovarius sp. MMSF_3281 TaxID=3046694 RepID=UPI00273FECA5|nr:Yip1 family protein [Roseovarius sp. MMSF_3281]